MDASIISQSYSSSIPPHPFLISISDLQSTIANGYIRSFSFRGTNINYPTAS